MPRDDDEKLKVEASPEDALAAILEGAGADEDYDEPEDYGTES